MWRRCAFPIAIGRKALKAWIARLPELTAPERKLYTHLSSYETSGIYNLTMVRVYGRGCPTPLTFTL